MIKISALNDESASGQSKASFVEVTTKEAQEEAAFSIYNRGLEFLNDNKLEDAEDAFREIVKISAGTNKETNAKEDDKKTSTCPSLLLLYSAFKNLANIDIKREDYESAMESYLEAVSLDSSDVSLWFRIGTTALKIYRYSLASLAFQEALKCNPNHWPSLDNVVVVLYVLNDYSTCLYFLAQILKRDPYSVKSLALRDQIFREHPGLRKDVLEYFSECDDGIFNMSYDQEEGQRYIDEALNMRNMKRKLSQPTAPPVLHFVKPLNEKKTWKNLGECLVDLYNLISQASRPISFSCRLNISKYLTTKTTDDIIVSKSKNVVVIDATDVSKQTEVKGDEDEAAMVCDLSEITDVTHLQKDLNQNLESKTDTSLPARNEFESTCPKKSRKRKSFPFEFIDAASKRRSTRVRNTLTKKEPDHVNFAELLQSFLPSSLLSSSDEGESIEANSRVEEERKVPVNKSINLKSVKSLKENEGEDVFQFLKSCCVNTGVLDVLYRYLMHLIDYQHKLWPQGLMDVYIESYRKVRDHITHPSLFCQDRENCDIKDEGIMTLCYCEFKLDKFSSVKMNQPNGTTESAEIPKPVFTFQDVNDRHFSVDLDFLNHLCLRSDILGDLHTEFCARVLWLKARFHILQNQSELAVDCFEKIQELLKEPSTVVKRFFLVNCNLDNEISLDNVNKQLESLQQSKSFGDLNQMFAAGEYQRVVDLIIPTFTSQKDSDKIIINSAKLQDRYFQLLLLQEALYCLEDRQQWLKWGEASLHEVWEANSFSSNLPSKQMVFSTVTDILNKLELCICKEPSVVHTLPATKLKRLINTLVQILVQKMQTSSHISEMPFKTNTPWIIFYLIIQQEEEKIKALMVKAQSCEDGTASESNHQDSENCSDSEFGPGMPSSLMLLYSAHEYLGRRGWCCASEGALLLFYSNRLLQELKKYSVNNPHPYKEDLEMSIEQCFYCLYGHPNKKTKAKYLQDHGVQKIALTWERAIPVFEYFRPKELPAFDSVKTISISAELEYLLKRIYALVLPEDDANKLEIMRSYIDGDINELPDFGDIKEKPIIKDLYYLLADYYFKNNEQGKAIKFYLLDICVNQDRLDSWAGLALARSSQLEQRLNSCDVKFDGAIFQKAKSVSRCFERALQLDPSATALWIEYGSLTYMLHSYSCRQLKQTSPSELGNDAVQMLNLKRNEMLVISKRCFESAIDCESAVEEEWLLHYMLGKIAEKMARPIKEYLNHYKLAAKHLYMEGARYPKKIQYHNPPNLALEALEVYYRIHSSIMKFLLKRESTILDSQTYETLESYLNDAAEGQFLKFQEKRRDSQNASDGDDSVQLPEECIKSKKVNVLANDHDYFKRKRKTMSHDTSAADIHPHLSSDSADFAVVKDVMNLLISGVVEKNEIIVESASKEMELILSLDKDTSTELAVNTRGSSKSSTDNSETEVKANMEGTNVLSPSKSLPAKTGGTTGGKDTVGHRALILRCEEALRQCLQRFPQHYKSLYRLSHYYYASRFRKNVQWSWDYLLGSQLPWNQCGHMCSPALFSERKNSNFFNGIWRIPIDEIDRSGCFATHMYRSVALVIDVLTEIGDHNLVVHLALQLHRNPDAGKKYIRDADRLALAKRACDESIYLLLKRMRQLCREESTTANQTRVTQHLLLLFRAWQNFQKVVNDVDSINDMLIKAFCIFRRGQIDPSLPVLDQAIRFCQQQQALIRLPLTPTSLGEMPVFPSNIKQPKPSTSLPTEDSSAIVPVEAGSSGSAIASPQMGSESLSVHHVPKPASNAAGQSRSPEVTNQSLRNIPSINGLHPIRSPKLLTADVQSKIKSLDPICESQTRSVQQMSGFQLEFLRQISNSVIQSKPAKIMKSSSTDN